MKRAHVCFIIFCIAVCIGMAAGSSYCEDEKKTAENYFTDGVKNYDKADYGEAAKNFNKAISVDPQYASAYFGLSSMALV